VETVLRAISDNGETIPLSSALILILRLTVGVRRGRDSEEFVEHIVRIILRLDLRESIMMLAKDVFRLLIVLLLQVS
jgi:hypothetical protein